MKIEIEWEDGELEHHWFWMPELPTIEAANVEGREWLAKRVPLPALRLGYHHIRLLWVHEPELETFAEARLIVCPRRAKPAAQRVRGARGEPLRTALRAQLGLRRFHGSASL